MPHSLAPGLLGLLGLPGALSSASLVGALLPACSAAASTLVAGGGGRLTLLPAPHPALAGAAAPSCGSGSTARHAWQGVQGHSAAQQLVSLRSFRSSSAGQQAWGGRFDRRDFYVSSQASSLGVVVSPGLPWCAPAFGCF